MLIRMGMGGQLSGSVGGVTASRNRFGMYLRNRTVPVNPQSVRQNAARAIFGTAATDWSNLTGPQRENWAAYAATTPVLNRLGETVYLNGFQMYVASAAVAIATNISAFSDAPATPGRATFGAPLAVTLSEATGVTIATTGNTATRGLCSISPPLGDGQASAAHPLTLFAVFTGAIGSGVTQAGNQAVNRYGTPVDGQRRVVRIVGIDAEGKLTDSVQQIVTVTA